MLKKLKLPNKKRLHAVCEMRDERVGANMSLVDKSYELVAEVTKMKATNLEF